MSVIVAVHGIAQQQLGRHQLLDGWARAAADGLERATGTRQASPPLDIAFYGDLFLDPARQEHGTGQSKGHTQTAGISGSNPYRLDDLSEHEVEDLLAVGREIIAAAELVAVPPAKGFPRVPAPLRAMMAALDRRFGPTAGRLFVGELRQVRRYLSDPALKKAIDGRVGSAITPDTRAVVGHSLGSVVAFEVLRATGSRPVDTLITLGSPLGLRAIRDRLPVPDQAAPTLPMPSVTRWTNIRDPRDVVTCAGDLADLWSCATDVYVDNGRDPHSATRYLGKEATGRELLRVLPNATDYTD